MPKLPQPHGLWLKIVPVFLVVCASTATAWSDDSFFGNLFEALGLGGRQGIVGEEAAGAVEEAQEEAAEAVAGAAENQFTPHFKKLLATELYFVRKVCDPGKEELEQIRQAGMKRVHALAQQYQQLMLNNRMSQIRPEVRSSLTAVLQTKIKEVLPQAAAERYAAEIAAREAARREAASGMMTVIVDRKVLLSPKQFDAILEKTQENWHAEWSRDLQIYLYDEYAPVPTTIALNSVLNDRQREVWGARMDYGTVFFGWEQDLGLNWGGAVDLGEEEAEMQE